MSKPSPKGDLAPQVTELTPLFRWNPENLKFLQKATGLWPPGGTVTHAWQGHPRATPPTQALGAGTPSLQVPLEVS